jgi:hypothetical protein
MLMPLVDLSAIIVLSFLLFNLREMDQESSALVQFGANISSLRDERPKVPGATRNWQAPRKQVCTKKKERCCEKIYP